MSPSAAVMSAAPTRDRPGSRRGPLRLRWPGRPARRSCGTLRDDLPAGDDNDLAEHGAEVVFGDLLGRVGVEPALQVVSDRTALARCAAPGPAQRAGDLPDGLRWHGGVVYGLGHGRYLL